MINSLRNIIYSITKQFLLLFTAYFSLVFLSNILPVIVQEFGLVEVTQNILLIYSLVLHFQFRKLYVRISNLFTFLIRQLFILFILYEELSFLTFSSNNLNNSQQEFNLHNSYLMDIKLFTLTIPNTTYSFTLILSVLLLVIAPFIFGFGSYFPFLKKFRYFFLEKQYATYTLVFVLHFVSSTILRKLNIVSNLNFIKSEYLELFFYLLIFIDTLKKRKIFSERNSK